MRRSAIVGSISVAVLPILFALFVGCASAPLPVGTFRGEKRLAVSPGTDPVVADQLRRIELKIRDDGAATLEDGGLPWEGRVTRDGTNLDFEVYAVDGINIAKNPSDLPRNLTFKILADGSLMYDVVPLRKVTAP